mmetsp:Transcript_45985/g.75006  ORF Transcript_45985/g.75006 Transcript_45985/m.75006 type:complete len:300 (-) Transcript_45985:153-1052(-)
MASTTRQSAVLSTFLAFVFLPALVVAIRDPLITTLQTGSTVRLIDGTTVTYIGCGDYVLLESPSIGLMYQSRNCVRGSSGAEASSTCALALKCSSEADPVELHATSNKLEGLIAGSALSNLNGVGEVIGRDVTITRMIASFRLKCHSSGLQFDVLLRESTAFLYFDVRTSIPLSLFGELKGLLGSFNGIQEDDVSYRDGRLAKVGGASYINAMDFPELDRVQDSWTVQKSESLFTVDFESLCTTASRRHILSSVLASPDSAFDKCMKHGLNGIPLQTCVFDYVVTGDDRFVSNAKLMRW